MAFLSMACTNESSNTGYINISRTSYTLNGNGKDSCVINVESDTEWEMEIHDEWISATRAGGDSVIIKASANETESIRRGSVAFLSKNASCEMIVEQTPKSFTGKMINFPLTARGAISPNGKYAAYLNSTINMETSEYTYYGVKINLETMEETSIPALRSDMTQYYYINIQAISDDGRTIIYADDGNIVSTIAVDDQEIKLTLPQDTYSVYYSGMSGDGSVIVGTITLQEGQPVPAVWRNGELELLEVPDVDSGGNELTNGVYARGCSADGSVIYGSEWDHQGLIYWKDGEMFYPGYDYAEPVSEIVVNTIYKFASYYSVSPNGKYIGAAYSGGIPVIMNTETGVADFFETDFGQNGAETLTVTDEGLAFGGTPTMGMSTGLVLDFENDSYMTVTDWMKEHEGLTVSNMLVNYHPSDKVFYGMIPTATALGMSYPEFVLITE